MSTLNYKAILHIQDSRFCYPLDGNTVELRLRTDKSNVLEGVNVIYGNKYDFYLKQQSAPMQLTFTDGSFNWYTAVIKLQDVRFVYIFELFCGGKRYFFCEDGLLDRYDFSLAYYNSFQLPYVNAADVPVGVDWFDNAVFYEIFVDRFCRGSAPKDESYVNLKWGDAPTPKSFAGGDLWGVADKLDYLQSLGVNTLYLTPIFCSTSNHKYDIYNYFDVDAQFGGKAALRRLTDEAHSRKMRIVLDAVFNHCSENTAQFADVLQHGKQSRFFDWFIVRGERPVKGNFECFGVCDYMPKWNTSNPDVQQWLIDVALYWMKEYGIDGWRLDVSDEVSHDFWRNFRRSVKKADPNCVILGENWHDSAPFLGGDQFDGVMNYSLTKALIDYIVEGNLTARQCAEKLSELYMRNTATANRQMLNLLDSHDTHRFFTLCGKNIHKLCAALSVIFVHSGAPCVYYGTELPLEGGYDPDCRRTMDWSKRGELCDVIAGLSRLRKEFVDGDIRFGSCGDLLVIERLGQHRIRLTVNGADTPQPFVGSGRILLQHNLLNGVLGAGFVIEETED